MISVQVGQCGNQVGLELYTTLRGEIERHIDTAYSAYSDEAFFRHSDSKDDVPFARSVLVDMEPKVIQHAVSTAKKGGLWQYDDSRIFTKQSGSANNWAFGYNHHAKSSSDRVEELIRKEVEACDALKGFFVMLSVGGGTGSGVGTYLTELLRDNYRDSFIGVLPVWPFTSGDVIVQNYNSVLSLAHLYQVADALITIENDQLQLICTKLLNIKKISFSDMNRVIARNLASVFLPFDYSSNPNSIQVGPSSNRFKWFAEPITHLCSHPTFKLLNFKSVPQMPQASIAYTSYIWPGIVKRLYQMLITDAKIDEGIDWNLKVEENPRKEKGFVTPRRNINRSLANLVILRGTDLPKADCSLFMNENLYSPLSIDPVRIGANAKPFNTHDKSATLLSNSQSVVAPLDKILEKAYGMFRAKAFVYQYEKYGIGEDDFEENFVQLESVVQNYKNL